MRTNLLYNNKINDKTTTVDMIKSTATFLCSANQAAIVLPLILLKSNPKNGVGREIKIRPWIPDPSICILCLNKALKKRAILR